MENFPVTINNKEYWISRSVAVAGFIFCIDNGLRVLANKRGKSCPDEIGKWNCPCGYLDYNETLKEACAREIYEETNLKISPDGLFYFGFDDTPIGKQNISFRFWALNNKYAGQTVYAKGAEKDEVEDVDWVFVGDLDKYEWAFNHEKLIAKIVLAYFKGYISEDTKEKLKNLITEENA